MEMKVTLNGVERTITNQQLYDLAKRGMIGPDTPVYIDGKPVPAGRAKGIVFGGQQQVKNQPATEAGSDGFVLPSQKAILDQHRREDQERLQRQFIAEQRQREEQEKEKEEQGREEYEEQQRRNEEQQKLLAQYNLKNVASGLRFSGIGVAVALLVFLFSAIGNVGMGRISLEDPITSIGQFVGIFIVTLLIIPVLFSFGLLKSLRYSYHNLPTSVLVILYILCLRVPLLNLLVMVTYAIIVGRAASQATRLLESADYEIGFLGPKMRQFDTYSPDAKFEEAKPVAPGRLLFFTLAIGGTLAVLIIISFIGLLGMRTNRVDQNHEPLSATADPATTSISNIGLIRKKAEQGDPIAQNNLGVCYSDGDGIPQNYEEAVKWFRKSAEQGYINGQAHLGLCYERGNGVALDKKEAAKWYRKAGEQGHMIAQNNLGICYLDGNGVEQDAKEAARWFRMAAEQGYPTAQYNLGVCYYSENGIEKNAEEAVKWLQKAAEQNSEPAQFLLASFYENGIGVEQDFTNAMKWYRKVADSNSSGSHIAQAQFVLGVGYYSGLGVPEDKAEAKKWLEKAAAQGNEDAIELLKEGFDE